MKKSIITFVALLIGSTALFAQRVPPPVPRKVQVAILFDTSNSMDGLIDQAKSRIWNIVNEVSDLTYNGLTPTIEISLYQYGNDHLSSTDNYVQQILPLTSDLDDLSQKLFALSTNGGEEYCGAVINRSLNDLGWSTEQTDLKMIYIAGNEDFNQGPIKFEVVCKEAAKKGVYVNTIYCGPYDQGVKEHWYDGAMCSQGNYFNIDSDKAVVHIDTPYDEDIRSYNDSINTTYYGYGDLGVMKKTMQMEEDANAAYESPSVATERSIVKSKGAVYNNASWDLIDAVDDGDKDLLELKEEELPDEFKGKTDEEKTALLDQKRSEREHYQTKVAELAKQRQSYIDVELKKREALGDVDDFGTSVNESIMLKAEEIGFTKEANN